MILFVFLLHSIQSNILLKEPSGVERYSDNLVPTASQNNNPIPVLPDNIPVVPTPSNIAFNTSNTQQINTMFSASFSTNSAQSIFSPRMVANIFTTPTSTTGEASVTPSAPSTK